MHWLRPLFLFLIAGLSVCNARAADESSQPATLDLNNQMLASSGEQAAALLQSPWDNSRSTKRMHSYGVLEPDDVAEVVVAGLADERFLILPHTEVETYERRRAEDRERWLRGMRRVQSQMSGRR